MKFKKLLFHTRFKELAFNSLVSIMELKQAGLEEIVFTHIVPRDRVAFVPYGGHLKDEAERLVQVAKIRFKDWQDAIADEGINSTIRVEVGVPNAKILNIAKEENVDLIVCGRKKRTAFEKIYVGEHILDVIRRSHLPVLMSKYMVTFEWEGEQLTRINDHIYKRPLLATDWSEPAEMALEAVKGLRGAVETVVITHILDAKMAKYMSKEGLKSAEDENRALLQKWADALAAEGIQAETRLAYGQPATEIIRMSREHKATMIVMGTTGKDWFREYWLGGSSHRVAELSEMPVLLVPVKERHPE